MSDDRDATTPDRPAELATTRVSLAAILGAAVVVAGAFAWSASVAVGVERRLSVLETKVELVLTRSGVPRPPSPGTP